MATAPARCVEQSRNYSKAIRTSRACGRATDQGGAGATCVILNK